MKQKKIALFAMNIFSWVSFIAQVSTLILAITMDSWPSWFRVALAAAFIISFLIRTFGVIISFATIVYLGVDNDILDRFPNDLSPLTRLVFILLLILAVISLVIFNKYRKAIKTEIKDDLSTFMGDKMWENGYYHPPAAGEK